MEGVLCGQQARLPRRGGSSTDVGEAVGAGGTTAVAQEAQATDSQGGEAAEQRQCEAVQDATAQEVRVEEH